MAGATGVTDSVRPNVVVIVADDLGYADLGCQGARDIATPHIDGLARDGVRFTNGYVTCPVCSPTRAGLLTGRYQQRFGHEFNPGRPPEVAPNFGLPLAEATLADRLRAAGYATGLVGKWHLGLEPRYHPLRRGFDEYFGFLHGSHSYVNARAEAWNPILRGTEAVDEREYLTDALTREAVAFVDRNAGRPFFLLVTYNAVHQPLDPPPRKYLDRFAGIADPKRRTYAAMLAALDDGVGAVMTALGRHGVAGRTLVFFVSDNGGPTEGNTSRNDPFSGSKNRLLEGGIRVPFVFRWTDRVPRGLTFDAPVSSLDIFATAVGAAGSGAAGGGPDSDRSKSTIDGVDLVPHVTGARRAPPHEALFWRYGDQAAVRKGAMKLVRLAAGPWRLHDLDADPGEARDLAPARPDVVRELDAAFAAWQSGMRPPLWAPRARDRGAAR